MSSRRHDYRHLDNDDAFQLAFHLDMRKLAEEIEKLNYGTHRLLSHLVDVRREELAERIAIYRNRGDDDIADSVERVGDKLADAIERLLDEGEF